MTQNDTANDDEASEEQRGVTEVSGCAACTGLATGGDKFCSEKCRERGGVDDTPL